MLNTGSGISQHFSYMESNLEKYPDLRYRLLFGVRTEKDIYYADELARLKGRLKDFEYEFVRDTFRDSLGDRLNESQSITATTPIQLTDQI